MAKGCVLVVDDDAGILDMLTEALAYEGYVVLTAVGGGALTLAHDEHPDVILLDLMMPDMDGVEVSKRLHADPATAGIPIVVMSAHTKMDTLVVQMAAQDRLRKPFDFDVPGKITPCQVLR